MNIVLLTIDALRADFLGCYGAAENFTPYIDAIAKDGAVFQNCFSHIPITGPSISTLFSSLYPSDHGVRNNAQSFDLPERLPVILSQSGFACAAFVGLGVLKSVFGFSKGFSTFEDRFEDRWWKHADELGDAARAWLRENAGNPFFLWIHYCDPHEPYAAPDSAGERLTIQLNDSVVYESAVDQVTLDLKLRRGKNILKFSTDKEPRSPQELGLGPDYRKMTFMVVDYVFKGSGIKVRFEDNWYAEEKNLHSRWRWMSNHAVIKIDNRSFFNKRIRVKFRFNEFLTKNELRQRYGEEVKFVDRDIGRLVDQMRDLNVFDDSLFILTADHGEELMDHEARVGHLHGLFDTSIRVPLIFRFPDKKYAGKQVFHQVSHIDMLPTIVDFLHLKAADGWKGQSLLGLLDGICDPFEEKCHFAELFKPEGSANLQALRWKGFKLIKNTETNENMVFNLAEDRDEHCNIAADDRGTLNWLEDELMRVVSGTAQNTAPKIVDDRIAERLRALGYME